jgi:hypothetical protein
MSKQRSRVLTSSSSMPQSERRLLPHYRRTHLFSEVHDPRCTIAAVTSYTFGIPSGSSRSPVG